MKSKTLVLCSIETAVHSWNTIIKWRESLWGSKSTHHVIIRFDLNPRSFIIFSYLHQIKQLLKIWESCCGPVTAPPVEPVLSYTSTLSSSLTVLLIEPANSIWGLYCEGAAVSMTHDVERENAGFVMFWPLHWLSGVYMSFVAHSTESGACCV